LEKTSTASPSRKETTCPAPLTFSKGLAGRSADFGLRAKKTRYTSNQQTFLNLASRNIDAEMHEDDLGKQFCCLFPSNPCAKTATEEEHWEADLMKCDLSNEQTFKSIVMIQLFDRHSFGDLLDYSCNSRWVCDQMPSRYPASEFRMRLPAPDLVVAFKTRQLPRMADLGEFATLMYPEGLQGYNRRRAFPFFSLEVGNGIATNANHNTASLGLHNMYLFMKAAGSESDFFGKVRFYSAVASPRRFELRVHRALHLGLLEDRIQDDYPLGFTFDRVFQKEGHYTKPEISRLVEGVLFSYGVGVLLPILKRAIRDLQFQNDK
jgi:hypothetical protein